MDLLTFTLYVSIETNRIYHWFPMQTEKFQPEGERMMPEMRFAEFPALSVETRVGIFQPAWRPMFDYFSYL